MRVDLFNRKHAQTSMELAVFGAVLIFVLGLIIRQSFAVSTQQDANLKAMRMAMMLSYQFSEARDRNGNPIPGLHSRYGSNSRNSASIILVEDRMSPDASKFGAMTRTPLLLSGRAIHSNNLFQPTENGETWNLPVVDMFINGQHFPFRVAGFKTITGFNSAATLPPAMPPAIYWQPVCSDFRARLSKCTYNPYGVSDCIPACPNYNPTPHCSTPGSPIYAPPITYGCTRFFTVVPNHEFVKKWCDDSPGFPCAPQNNLAVEDRFDLDHDPATPNPISFTDGIFPDYHDFSWQWYLIKGFNEDFLSDEKGLIGTPVAEGILVATKDRSGKNTSIDADGDFKEEVVVAVDQDSNGVIKTLTVIDSQEGDMDFSRGPNDPGVQPGLERDSTIFSFTLDGTYLEQKEQRFSIFQFVSQTQKKNQVDIVERVINLTKDTDRFCDSSGHPTTPFDEGRGGLRNPVEACNDCLTTANRIKTCMDETKLKIYVRSRVQDLHGRKWVTNITQDDYVDFKNQ